MRNWPPGVQAADGIACMYALDATTLEDGQVKLNDGVRRWMVARELGLAAVPVEMRTEGESPVVSVDGYTG
jgi:hypothetical protein